MCDKKTYINQIIIRSKECSPCYVKRKGVLSVEASICVPLFLIAMMALISIANMYYVYERVYSSVCEEARYIAVYSHDGNAYSIGGVQANIEERLGEKLINSGLIRDGAAGLDFSESDLSNQEIAIIAVNYYYAIPFGITPLDDIKFSCRAVIHTWTGYVNGLNGLSSISEYVYMTKNGKVYHRSRECSHIRLHIRCVSGKDMKSLRNNAGGKYKKCEYCKPKLKDERLYVTEDGDRYHNSLTCSGLKRTVVRVRLSDIEGVSACSRCGY